MKRRANGEGSVYETVKKNKRKVFLEKECAICSHCTDRKACNGRIGWEKCDKCKQCTVECLKYCDRFYCYKTIATQVSVNGVQRSSGTSKNKREAIKIKEETSRKLNRRENMQFGNFSLVETMKYNEDQKLKFKLIGENAYNRNLNTISSIEKHYLSTKNMCELAQNDIKTILAYFVETGASQSQLEKVYDEIKGACKMCDIEYLFKGIARNTFVSEKEKREVICFSASEKNLLFNYINSKPLVCENKSNIDNDTIKNIIKFAFYSGMRIGEICCLNFDTDIDMNNKRIIVSKTLTQNVNKETIVGFQTKTGRKNKKSGKSNTRYVPFDILTSEISFLNMLNEQLAIAKANQNNTRHLLFCSKDGNFIPRTSINSIFKRICREVGIKPELTEGCHIHMTKHTAVTEMIEASINIYAISAIVGTSVNVLQETYAHVLDSFIDNERKKMAAKRMENLTSNYETEGNCKIIPFKKL